MSQQRNIRVTVLVLLVVPSLGLESFGLVAREAMTCGVPVVASDVGEYGAFFDTATGVVSNDMSVWVTETARLLGSPDRRQRVADRAREAFCQQLSVGYRHSTPSRKCVCCM